jgi:hypothetical protein
MKSERFSLRMTVYGFDANGNAVEATGRVDLVHPVTTSAPKTSPPIVSNPDPSSSSVLTVTFDPNPTKYDASGVHYKIILTNTSGVGITLKKATTQSFSSTGPGQLHVYETLDWFSQWLPNAYLPPNGKASLNAGTGFGWLYCIHEFFGIDDNGNQIFVTARVDFIK